MKLIQNNYTKFYIAAIILIIQSCAVKWIADYDTNLANETIDAAKTVDAYYMDLISITDNSGINSFNEKLARESFEVRYKEIDNTLYGIYLKNKSKPLNKNSTTISKSVLEKFWRKYQGDLETKKALLVMHRKNFSRNFEAMLKAENAKETTK